ncbi:MAG: hypothetical protein H0W72_05660 [Planctomycetes bacterium]|nr:hypothetical protein [Planctomycetota bacterium]
MRVPDAVAIRDWSIAWLFGAVTSRGREVQYLLCQSQQVAAIQRRMRPLNATTIPLPMAGPTVRIHWAHVA